MKLRIRQDPFNEVYYVDRKDFLFWHTLAQYSTLQEANKAAQRYINKNTYYREWTV